VSDTQRADRRPGNAPETGAATQTLCELGPMIPPVRIAHRGASGAGLAPENTLAAFEHAIHLGVDAIEIDVHATRDNQLVVLHDNALDRTTDQRGLVSQLTLEQVRQADAGAWVAPSFAGERVPTLQEVLELARHRALVLIEIKADHISERVLQVITSMRADDQVVVQSFNADTIRGFHALDPGIPTALLMGRLPRTPARLRARRMVRQLLELGTSTVSLWHGALGPALLEELRKRTMTVWVWTVDEEMVLRDMVSMGVHGIITNYPNRLNAVIGDLQDDGRIHAPAGRRQRALRTRWARRRRLRQLRRGAAPA
jgi:glycerophosphoryl diester phosphodiesterase